MVAVGSGQGVPKNRIMELLIFWCSSKNDNNNPNGVIFFSVLGCGAPYWGPAHREDLALKRAKNTKNRFSGTQGLFQEKHPPTKFDCRVIADLLGLVLRCHVPLGPEILAFFGT